VRGHQGLVVLMRFQRNSGPFCRPCGTAVVREMSAKTLVLGWWGIASVFVTPVTLLMNLVTSRRLKSLPPPGPATPRPPLDPGMPLLRRPQALGLALPLILVVIIVAAVLAGRDDARNAKAGDCVRRTGSDAVEIVDCTSPRAQYRVLSRISANLRSLCTSNPDAVASYTETGGSSDFMLCLGRVR
jgi:hypothetical protein